MVLLRLLSDYYGNLEFWNRFCPSRQHILLAMVFEDVTKGLICFWIAILAFHKALSEQPRDAVVVAAFTLAVHNGGDMSEAVEIARTITKPHEVSFHELLEPQKLSSGAYTKEIKDLEASFRQALDHMTDVQIVSEAMSAYPQTLYSDMVFISWGLSLRVSRIFGCISMGGDAGSVAKQGSKIDYESLAQGSLPEIRHIFARVVFDTIYPL